MKNQNPYQYDDSDINDHFEIDYLLETESTNDEIASLEMNHTRPWKVVVAEKQSAGKGRLGRIWESPPHKNLYFSIKIPLKNNFKVEQSALANLVAALSLYKTLSSFHIPSLRIKWPNDLYIKNKKIAGILSELIQKEEHYYFIIGVGLNVNSQTENFSEELQKKASSLYLETNKLYDRVEILKSFLKQIQNDFTQLFNQGFTSLKNEWTHAAKESFQYSLNVIQDSHTHYLAKACGITDEGYLILQKENGEISELMVGDILEKEE